MKQFAVILLLLLPLTGFCQADRFYREVFNRSVIAEVLKYHETDTKPPYNLVSGRDRWIRSRFFFERQGPDQHAEAMNFYAYNDSIIKKLITPRQWSMLVHMALPQYGEKVKTGFADIKIQSLGTIPGGIYFSITRPVVYENIALIDLTYYAFDNQRKRGVQECNGKALFVFQRTGSDWILKRVLNNPLL